MKNTTRKFLSLLGTSLVMSLTVAAQDQPKVKVNEDEVKYKSDNVKIKVQEEEGKYKSEGLKVKANGEETKIKSDDLKIKANDEERKIKGTVTPNQPSAIELTETRVGETNVRTKEAVRPAGVVETTTVVQPAPAMPQVAPKPVSTTVSKRPAARTYNAARRAAPKRTAARRTGASPQVVVRTRVVKDTVYVPSPPERIVTTQTEYVRDTVVVTRVDTVMRTQVVDTYTGYRVPEGDFKKVKLERKKNGEVRMKRKE